MIVFSPSTGQFYAADLQADYVAAGTWQTDSVPVAADVWQTFAGSSPAGKVRGTVNGLPGWVDAPVVTLPPSPVVTSTAFLNRFQPAELAALASNPQTLLLLITCAAAGEIDLTDPAVIAGINGLTGAGILAAGRATAILTP